MSPKAPKANMDLVYAGAEASRLEKSKLDTIIKKEEFDFDTQRNSKMIAEQNDGAEGGVAS